ncbi:MAG: GNAT family N-acetyltransferase, partial [Chloroflexota bacterium]
TWPEGFSEQDQRQDWLSHQENHPIHFVLVDDSCLISHAAVVWKYLEHAGATFKAYGLSGVFTQPACRERGYGSRIVEAGTAYIKAGDADIGMLWCAPSLKRFYARSGWVGMEQAKTLIGPTAAPRVYPLLLMMLFLSQQGQDSRAAFEDEAIYFGLKAW